MSRSLMSFACNISVISSGLSTSSVIVAYTGRTRNPPTPIVSPIKSSGVSSSHMPEK